MSDLIDALRRSKELPTEPKEETEAEIAKMDRQRTEKYLKLWPHLDDKEASELIERLKVWGFTALADKLKGML